ncbi:hypothetical protein MKX01_001833 [Papaver californicum]|nr:hypothetical protein MKX01_040075 [Papaver californicum]KAI3966061.1 hypothetical protein MKX01_001542 [Papaver californicum]KAI3971265.1 hypothetical protein MKX01_001833 [Papaver californicum]
MGGKRQKKSSSSSFFSSIFSIFKSSRSSNYMDDMGWDDAVNVRKVRPSDDDKGRWVAEPDIDRKASAFIARFYESRVSDPDRQTVAPV